jgi:hypothetical protein
MISKVEGFIFENFKTMPLWVRVITYFMLLIVLMFGYMSPRFIDGVAYLKVKKADDPIYYKNLSFSVIEEGRKIRYTSSDEGILSIPRSTLIPTQPVEIHFYPEGVTQAPVKRIIPIWTLLTGKNIDFTYIDETKEMLLSSLDKAFAIPFISSVYADVYLDEESKDLGQVVIESLVGLSSTENNEITLNTTLASLSLSQPKLAYLYGTLEKKYNVVVWAEIWKQANTVADLVLILKVALASVKKNNPSVAVSAPAAPVVTTVTDSTDGGEGEAEFIVEPDTKSKVIDPAEFKAFF